MPEPGRILSVSSLETAPTALWVVGLEAWVVDRMRPWFTDGWRGEMTLIFSGSGVAYVRERRQSTVIGEQELWGNIRYGRVSLVFRDGERYMVEEERTTQRPLVTVVGCGWVDLGAQCCLQSESCGRGR